MGGSAGVFADFGRGLSFECGGIWEKKKKALARQSRGGFIKSQFRGRNFPHLKITAYILQINLELTQHTNYLAVFKFQSQTALTIAPSFLWSLSTLMPN